MVEVSRKGMTHVKGITDQHVVMLVAWIWWDADDKGKGIKKEKEKEKGKGRKKRKKKNISWLW